MGVIDDGGVDFSSKSLGANVPFWGPFAVGVTPIIIPHKNRARYVLLADNSVRQDTYMATPYQVLDHYLQHYAVHTPVYLHRHQSSQTSSYHSHVRDVYDDTYLYPPAGPHQLPGAPAHVHRDVTRHITDVETRGPVHHVTETVPLGVIADHYSRAYSVARTEHQVLSRSENIQLHEIIETNSTTLLGGALAFVAVGPVALGMGLIGHGRWDVTSHRKVIGRQAAYMTQELDPPKSAQDIAQWREPYTNISWLQTRGMKVVAGVYSVAHAGAIADIEGIWRHQVKKEIKKLRPTGPEVETVTVTLSLKKQGRLKGSIGAIPFLSANHDLIHAAKTNEISFRFINPSTNPHTSLILDRLVKGHDKNAILQAKQLSDVFAAAGAAPETVPLTFIKETIRNDQESRNRLRARLPLIANAQLIKKKRVRTEKQTVNIGGSIIEQNIVISEAIKRRESQYPIESFFRKSSKRIHPQRVGVDSSNHVKWPLDYRNSSFTEITQVRDTSQGDITAPYEVASARYIWSMLDNHISKNKFMDVLRRIGSQTGLSPILFSAYDIPDFTGPQHRPGHPLETMQMSLEVHLNAADRQQIFNNILQSNFVAATLSLYNQYSHNAKGEYLSLSTGYTSVAEYFKINKSIVEQQSQRIVNQARSIHKKLIKGRRYPLMMSFSRDLNSVEVMGMIRDLLDNLKVNPFVFLTALNHTSPSTILQVQGTSVNIERVIDVSLAKDIMENKSALPMAYEIAAPPPPLSPPPLPSAPSLRLRPLPDVLDSVEQPGLPLASRSSHMVP